MGCPTKVDKVRAYLKNDHSNHNMRGQDFGPDTQKEGIIRKVPDKKHFSRHFDLLINLFYIVLHMICFIRKESGRLW